MFASGYTPVYPCHVSTKDMRTNPIGTGPFKFVEFKRGESIKFVRNPDYWKKGKPYLDGIEWKVIENRSTRILAFVAGEFDMTFTTDVTIPLLKDMQHAGAQGHLRAGADLRLDQPDHQSAAAAPFNDPKIRKAMALALDRKAFIDILSGGKADISGVMLPPPEGVWGMPPEVLQTLPGYAADVEKSRAEARKIMEGLGYSEAKPLKVKVSTRNIAIYRDPAVILIDQLKKIYIDGELEVVDTSIWHAKVTRGEYSVGLNLTGVGVDDPDVNLYENYTCNSERNLTKYCNKEVDALIDKQSQELDVEKRKQIVWEIERKLAEDLARPIIHLRARGHLLAAARQGLRAAPQQHLQQLALRGRVARQVALAAGAAGDQGEAAMGAYLVRRFLLMLVTLFGMSVLIFVMLRLVPGNITDIIFDSAGFVNPAAEEEDREASSASTSRSSCST